MCLMKLVVGKMEQLPDRGIFLQLLEAQMLTNIGNLSHGFNSTQMEGLVASKGSCQFSMNEVDPTCQRFCPLLKELIGMLV